MNRPASTWWSMIRGAAEGEAEARGRFAERFEERRARAERQPDSRIDLEAIEAREAPLSEIFDRAWGIALIREAVRVHEECAREKGERAELGEDADSAQRAAERERRVLALREAGRTEEALAASERATTLEPRHADHFVGLGSDLMLADRFEDAELAYRQALEIDPECVPAQRGLDEALIRQGD